MMKYLKIFCTILLITYVDCSFGKKSSFEEVHHAIINDGEVQIKTVRATDLEIISGLNWSARALFDGENYNKTGWSTLEIQTNELEKDHHQAYAAGFLEGHLTKNLISLHIINNVGDFCNQPSELCTKLIDFLQKNFLWLKNQIESNPDDPYWQQVYLVLIQFHGLYNGYKGDDQFPIDKQDILTRMIKNIKPYLVLIALQLNGDMSDLLASFNQVSDPFSAGSCSALVKLIGKNQDIYVSHDTWTEYESMLRILKLYKFNFHLNQSSSEFSFSSYPGILVSIDDFYVLKQRMAVMETTIGNSNTDLWKYVTSNTLLYWIRITVANRLAISGQDWAELFAKHNSGTYNNQWMVVDYNLFSPGEPLRDGLFTVLEQIPGNVRWEDKTDTLRQASYWSSYNIAYYSDIYNMSGTFDAYLKYGDFFSYTNSPRSQIFRRDHSKVVDLDSMIKIMRYNNYTKDPLSKCQDCNPPYSGENTIAARSDLNPKNGTYPFDALGHRNHGATDMKLTNFEMSKTLDFISIAGPTFDHEDVTPFVWSEADFGNTTNHFGHPDKWTFEPYYHKWNL